MKVAVLGSGNGGVATAFDWAQHGHEVALWAAEDYPGAVPDIAESGGISARGDMTGRVEIALATHDIGAALEGAQLVFVVGPAYATADIARAVSGRLTRDQVVVVNPGSCAGGILFKHTLGIHPADPTWRIAETSTLPYAVRLTGPDEITVYLRLKQGMFVAGVLGSQTAEITDLLAQVWPCAQAATSIFQTILQNGNPVIHPAVTLLNAALLERTGGDFLFYEEGVTPAVGRLIRGLDEERIALGAALGVEILSDPVVGKAQGYMADTSYDLGYSLAPGFRGIRAQEQLDHRYLNEDVGYGLVFFADLGARIGVPTPTTDAVIRLASVVMDRDYRAEAARTLDTLGLAGADLATLRAL